MTLSTHAAAAKAIRTELKKNGIKARVTCDSYSMGSSVRVELENEAPWTVKAITSFVNKFQYGHFNGMEDIYEYSNNREDIPQVKFVFVENNFTDELKQKAYEALLSGFGGYENHPEKYEDAQNMRGNSDWVSQEVFRVLNGSMMKFWNKPRIKAAA